MYKVWRCHEVCNKQQHSKMACHTLKKIQQLEQELTQTKTEFEQQQQLVKYYEEQVKLFQQRMYGTKSEKHMLDESQGTLFDEAESGSSKPVPATDIEKEVTENTRKVKQVGAKDTQLDKLPQEDVRYPLSAEQQICEHCAHQLEHMKDTIRRELIIVPARVIVRNHIQEVAVCKHCEQHGTKTTIRSAILPKPVLPKSIASAEALAFIMSEKYMKHLPLYRIETALQQFDIVVSRLIGYSRVQRHILNRCISLCIKIFCTIRSFTLMKRHCASSNQMEKQVIVKNVTCGPMAVGMHNSQFNCISIRKQGDSNIRSLF